MCGLVGFLDDTGGLGAEALRATCEPMADALRHRGPDDAGVHVDPAVGLALGHRRLSILDLSPEGHQPMRSAPGRYWIVFNGEIYNFAALRDALGGAGHRFRGHSDTEVMLAAFEEWGVGPAVEKMNGMFAFAAWDERERVLWLGRDRLGEKPLYYGWCGRAFLFGSELKALAAHPAFAAHAALDRDALVLYVRHNYIPAPWSVYRGIRKLPPGTLLAVRPGQAGTSPAPVAYWSVAGAAAAGRQSPFQGTPGEAVDALEALLREAVAMRMVADVPLGAFLSGGIDSSTVVALMQAASSRPVRTFTIGFREAGYDEAAAAREVARHLGTEHTELYVTPEEARAVIPTLPAIYDEPFADSSQIPTILVSRLARRHVTVSLSGDGGDELFYGYQRYLAATGIWRIVGALPLAGRRALAGGLRALPRPLVDRYLERHLGFLQPALRRYGREGPVGEKLARLAETLSIEDARALYLRLISHWASEPGLVLGGRVPPSAFDDAGAWPLAHRLEDRMMALDAVTYLPDDILAKVDRASMSVSLEGRVPLLDHRVVELALRLPLALKLREGKTKWVLRQVLYRHVPPALVERPKMGFGVPVGEWLRGPLRPWAEDLLDEGRLRRQGLLDPRPIRARWEEHLAGRRNHQYDLWVVLMLQAWMGTVVSS